MDLHLKNDLKISFWKFEVADFWSNIFWKSKKGPGSDLFYFAILASGQFWDLWPRYGFTPPEVATRKTASIPPLELGTFNGKLMEFQKTDAKFLGSMTRLRVALDKSKANINFTPKVQSTLGVSFRYSKGDTVHFKGTRDRNGTSTIIHSDGKYHIIGHSEKRTTTIHENYTTTTTTTTTWLWQLIQV